MLSLFFKWCEYIFPERKGHQLVRSLDSKDVLLLLKPKVSEDFTSLLQFSEPVVRALIHEAKFHHHERAWELLGSVLAQYLKQSPQDLVVLPIPLSTKRLRERGYNQTEEVTKRALAECPRHLLHNHLLYRTRDTKPQTSLKKLARRDNMVDAFGIHDGASILNQHILVVDDVVTTGATLKAAAAALRPYHPASITLLGLAH